MVIGAIGGISNAAPEPIKMKMADFIIATALSYVTAFIILFALVNWVTLSPAVPSNIFLAVIVFAFLAWPVIFLVIGFVVLKKIGRSGNKIVWLRLFVFSMGCGLSILGTIIAGVILSDRKMI